MSLSSDSLSSSSPAQWKLSQVFGDKLPGEDVQDIDIISSIDFDKTGDHLAVGDRGGRLVIFQNNGGIIDEDAFEWTSRNELERIDSSVMKYPRYRYKTEFQSHEPEFDYLKSTEIEEKINKVRWCSRQNESLSLLSANDKTIKLWKVKEHKVKHVKEMDIDQAVSSENSLLADQSFVNGESLENGHSLEWPPGKMENGTVSYNGGYNKVESFTDASVARCRKVYAHAHDFNVNSISVNSDCETFLSGDDLRINVWNLEISDQCFNIIDMKPVNMEDLVEVITSAEFHPIHCNLLAYSSSRGFVRLVDMRQSALCDHSARILKDEDSHGHKSFFTEIIASITDMKFVNDGRHILSRDYMNLKLWDMNMEARPVATFRIHENLRPKLCDLYNNDAIFDKFDCCVAGDRPTFATGSYSNLLRVFSYGTGNDDGITVGASKTPNGKDNSQTTSRPRRSSLSNLARGFYRQGHDRASTGSNEISYDISSKLLHLAWHPQTDLIASAAGNSLLLYTA